MKDTQTVVTLKEASLFLTVVGDEDVEQERLSLEATTGYQLKIHTKEVVTRSGVQMTRVEWEIVNG